MAIQTVNIGTTPNDGTGDPARTAFTKLNANFTQAENAASHLLLGTASQSGGVPTGAIIERGSNANGEYVRYADGTQICWTTPRPTVSRDIADGNVFRSALLGPHNWPIAFSEPPSVFGSTPSSEAGWMGALGTATLIYAVSYGPTSSAISYNYIVTGFGHWY